MGPEGEGGNNHVSHVFSLPLFSHDNPNRIWEVGAYVFLFLLVLLYSVLRFVCTGLYELWRTLRG